MKTLLMAAAKYKKGTRLLVKVNKEAFLGTVVSTRLGTVYIDCDDGDRLKVDETSKLILGEGIKRKVKKAIKLSEKSSYLEVSKDKKVKKTKTSIQPKSSSSHSIVIKPKERTYTEILNTISAMLSSITKLSIEKKTFSLGNELLIKAVKPIRGRDLALNIPIYEKAIKKELKSLGATFKTVKGELRFTLEGITFILRVLKRHSTNLFIIFRENNHVQSPEAKSKSTKPESYYYSTPEDVENLLKRKLSKVIKFNEAQKSRDTIFLDTIGDRDNVLIPKIEKVLADNGFTPFQGQFISPNRMLKINMNRYTVNGLTGKGLDPYVSISIRLQPFPVKM